MASTIQSNRYLVYTCVIADAYVQVNANLSLLSFHLLNHYCCPLFPFSSFLSSHFFRTLPALPARAVHRGLGTSRGGRNVVLLPGNRGRGRFEDEQALDGLQRTELGAEVGLPVEAGARPRDAARRAAVSDTALGGARGALLEKSHDGGLRARNEDGGLSQPAREAGLEGRLVRRACAAGLAFLLEHDARLGRLEEGCGGRVHEAVHVLLPGRVVGQVGHVRGAVEVARDVVGPFVVVHG